jgi:hypothetical protein
MARLVSGDCRFTSAAFSNRWSLACSGEPVAEMRRRPRSHVSEVALADGTELTLVPEGWGAVVARDAGGKELGRIVRRSWWGRRWDLESPTFGLTLTSDPLPRRWRLRVGDHEIGRLSGGLLSYNRLLVQVDVAVQVIPLVLAWHVLARPWEAAAAPSALVARAAPVDTTRGDA